ncbi:MAG TPA: hypothetical protein VGO66_07615 [Solirubrobacterales bacterium]|jgi:hypothetical protein|nr:hypothetical protein [Solirubrobacterales bacterium]
MSAVDREREEGWVEEEADAAAAEAARVGGPAPPSQSEDPAQRPLEEAGQGEAEGFELAEKDLKEIAEHGDEHRFPDSVVPPPEEPQGAEYGEADEENHQDS